MKTKLSRKFDHVKLSQQSLHSVAEESDIGSQRLEIKTKVDPDRLHIMQSEHEKVFVLRVLTYDAKTGELVFHLDPGNGMAFCGVAGGVVDSTEADASRQLTNKNS